MGEFSTWSGSANETESTILEPIGAKTNKLFLPQIHHNQGDHNIHPNDKDNFG